MQKLLPVHISVSCKVPIHTHKLESLSDSDTGTSLLSSHCLRGVEFSGLHHLFVAQTCHSTCLPQGGKTVQ